jgi:hypothetical protein
VKIVIAETGCKRETRDGEYSDVALHWRTALVSDFSEAPICDMAKQARHMLPPSYAGICCPHTFCIPPHSSNAVMDWDVTVAASFEHHGTLLPWNK